MPEFVALLETTGGLLDKSGVEGPDAGTAVGKQRPSSGHDRSMLGVRWRTNGLTVGGRETVPVFVVAASDQGTEDCVVCKVEGAVVTWKQSAVSIPTWFESGRESTINCLETRLGVFCACVKPPRHTTWGEPCGCAG